jgi:hypothetical protein
MKIINKCESLEIIDHELIDEELISKVLLVAKINKEEHYQKDCLRAMTKL